MMRSPSPKRVSLSSKSQNHGHVLTYYTESIAGQMAALKGGGAPAKAPARRKKPQAAQTVDDISSDSGTDGDDDDSSDTDTDTSSDEE